MQLELLPEFGIDRAFVHIMRALIVGQSLGCRHRKAHGLDARKVE